MNNYPAHVDYESLQVLVSMVNQDVLDVILSYLSRKTFLIQNIHQLHDDSDCHSWAIWYIGLFELRGVLTDSEILDTCSQHPILQNGNYDARKTNNFFHDIISLSLYDAYATVEVTAYVFTSKCGIFEDEEDDADVHCGQVGFSKNTLKETISSIQTLCSHYHENDPFEFINHRDGITSPFSQCMLANVF